jgi:hypothetical protein
MSGWRKKQIDQLIVRDHCNKLLEALVGPSLVDQWWDSPNKGFDGAKPRDVDVYHVQSYLLSHAYGGEYM